MRVLSRNDVHCRNHGRGAPRWRFVAGLRESSPGNPVGFRPAVRFRTARSPRMPPHDPPPHRRERWPGGTEHASPTGPGIGSRRGCGPRRGADRPGDAGLDPRCIVAGGHARATPGGRGAGCGQRRADRRQSGPGNCRAARAKHCAVRRQPNPACARSHALLARARAARPRTVLRHPSRSRRWHGLRQLPPARAPRRRWPCALTGRARRADGTQLADRVRRRRAAEPALARRPALGGAPGGRFHQGLDGPCLRRGDRSRAAVARLCARVRARLARGAAAGQRRTLRGGARGLPARARDDLGVGPLPRGRRHRAHAAAARWTGRLRFARLRRLPRWPGARRHAAATLRAGERLLARHRLEADRRRPLRHHPRRNRPLRVPRARPAPRRADAALLPRRLGRDAARRRADHGRGATRRRAVGARTGCTGRVPGGAGR